MFGKYSNRQSLEVPHFDLLNVNTGGDKALGRGQVVVVDGLVATAASSEKSPAVSGLPPCAAGVRRAPLRCLLATPACWC